MKQGGGRKKLKHAGGFTIVETMIVLAVSAALLSSAILVINGKQNRTAFQTSTNNLQQRFQQLINQTESGYYPGAGDFTCTGNPNGPATAPMSFTNTSTEQGSNGSCVFMGMTLLFKAPGYTGDNADKYLLFPMAGNRVGSSGALATTFNEAWPTAIARGNTYNSSFSKSGIVERTEAGLTYVWGSVDGAGITSPASRSTAMYAFAMLSNLDGGATASGLDSGAQQFVLYSFQGWPSPTPTVEAAVDSIDNTHQHSTYIPAPTRYYREQRSVELCFASSGTDQSALYIITGSFTVSMQIKDGKQC